MIYINTLVLVLILIEIIMFITMIAVIMWKKRECLFAVSQVVMAMLYILIGFAYCNIGEVNDYSGGYEYSNVQYIENNTIENKQGKYIVTLDTGRKYTADAIIYADSMNNIDSIGNTKLITHCKVIKTNIFNFKTYKYGNAIIINRD